MQFYNGIYSTFFSAIGSLSVAVVASLFTQNLYNNWFVFFIIFMILNSLMLFVNLSSKTLNVPMILMRLIFSLKNKFHSFKRLMFYI
ncbi:teichoic acid transporter, partial [Bacillus thuringiensis]